MTGFTQSDEVLDLLPIEAENLQTIGTSRLLVMPPPIDDGVRSFVLHRSRNNVIAMPPRQDPAPRRRRVRALYPGNAVECWPRGYPSHDDL